MKRSLQTQLEAWYKRAKRKPLILRGARQVGKSTLVRQFAESQKFDLVEVNLERYPTLDRVFQTNDVRIITTEIQAITGKPLSGGNTLLFLDEIQSAPNALASLRYFYEDRPELPVIAAGSLLEFLLAEHKFSMPVGRIEYLHMGAMDFSEFLRALGEGHLTEMIEQFRFGSPFPETAHAALCLRQRQFLFVGGMPEAVRMFVDNTDVIETRRVQHSIIQTYLDDFAKYAAKKSELQLLHKIMDALPRLIGRKLKYAEISREHRSVLLKDAVDLLVKARLLLRACHSDCSGLPLRAGRDERIVKPYFLDCGLLSLLCGVSWLDLSRWSEAKLVNEGFLAEQFVAQHLTHDPEGMEPPELHYWLREGASHNAEVDFVVVAGSAPVPVEVKLGKSGSLRSIHQFMAQKGGKIACRLDLNLPSVQDVVHRLTGPHGDTVVKYRLLSLPLYMAGKVRNLETRTDAK